jgi:hypothetical protein
MAGRGGGRRADGPGGLLPLGHFAAGNAAEAAKLERLRGAWPMVVGPGLCRHTHPISISNGLLLIGCHDALALQSMRAGAAAAWPGLRARIDALLGAHLQRVEVTPSDPPPARRGGGPEGGGGFDPLGAVLDICGAAGKGGGPGQKGGAPPPGPSFFPEPPAVDSP